MPTPQTFRAPSLVRIKPGALDRLGVYARREGLARVCLLHSADLPEALRARAGRALSEQGVAVTAEIAVGEADLNLAQRLGREAPSDLSAVIGLGGGRALDVAKYAAGLRRLPYLAVPTSLSNDGFASNQSSLLVEGRRRSLPAGLPAGVIVDTEVCLQAPERLWLSGVGDLAAKIPAVRDWKLAARDRGEPFNDFAALLSVATVYQFLALPQRDLEGVRQLATALLFCGMAMEMAGSSRPASGAEHLISHALDEITARPRLHGLQVGAAAYLVTRWQGRDHERIAGLFAATGFWSAVRAEPFPREDWVAAIRRAPRLRPDYYTVLSTRDFTPDFLDACARDPVLRGCFV